MKEWCRRIMWASPDAESRYAPVVRAWAAAWPAVELLSVGRCRPGALQVVAPAALPEISRHAADRGLALSVLQEERLAQSSYAAATPKAGALGLRIAIHVPGHAWHAAWGDCAAVGELLGFPPCCRAFFLETWGKGQLDPTGKMGDPAGPCGVNPLLRWLGVRMVPHLPCSFACEASAELASGMERLAREALPAGLVDDVLNLLGAPMRWTALHGAGEVEIPGVLKVSFSTDYTPVQLAVDRVGVAVPLGRGTCRSDHASLVPPELLDHEIHYDAASRQSAPDAPAPEDGLPPWADNGFRSEAAMSTAHAIVAQVAEEILAERALVAVEPLTVLDLGCGDGALLERLRSRFGSGTWKGCDCDAARIARGTVRHRELRLLHGRIEDLGTQTHSGEVDLVLLMPGRLLEMEDSTARLVRQAIRRIARHLVVYTYGGGGLSGLSELAARAGLSLRERVASSALYAAAEAEVIA